LPRIIQGFDSSVLQRLWNANGARLLPGMYVPVKVAMPAAENRASVTHTAEKLRAIADRRPEIAKDLRQMADHLDKRRKPTGFRQRLARAAVRRRLASLLPVLKIGRLHRFWT